MRIHIQFIAKNAIIPFNHLPLLTGTIHKWIGVNNQEHGEVSLYTFSWLQGGKKHASGKGLIFEHTGSFFISAHSNELLQSIIKNIHADNTMFMGLEVKEIIMQQDPDFVGKELFFPASPIFVKRKVDDVIKHYTFYDEQTSLFLKETLETKMKCAGIEDESLQLTIDKTYPKPKTKLVQYGTVKNKAFYCPIIIQAKPETKAFAWNVGLGNSTGIGFGALE